MQNLINNAKQGRDPATWNPPFCGDIDIEIRRNGQWFYLGSLIERIEIIKLFARVLQREGNEYFLVTPVEKVRIKVEDAPFVVTRCEWHDDTLQLCNNLEESVSLNSDHPLFFSGSAPQAQPYVVWRGALTARLSHAIYYELCERALQSAPHNGKHGIYSAQLFFAMEP